MPSSEVTDQRIAGSDGRDPIREAANAAAPYQLDMFRQSKNFDFAESLRNHPDPPAAGRSRPGAEGGQATKGTGWMPWRQEPMKDVAGCEKLREVASRR